MKIFTISILLFLSACANNTPDLANTCMYKNPDTMSDREMELCKAYFQRPIIYQN